MTAPIEVDLFAVGWCRQRQWLVDGARSAAWRVFPAMVAVLRHPRLGAVLFDTGYGRALAAASSFAARVYRRALPFHLPPEQELGTRLAGIGVEPRDLEAVFLSHLHPDHIGGLREVPAIPVVLSRAGLDHCRALGPAARLRAAFLPELLPDDLAARARAVEDRPLVPLGPEWAPFDRARDFWGDGSLLAIELPGHAVGQHGLACRLEGGGWLFLVADAAWVRGNFATLALPSWPARRWFGDPRTLVTTLGRLHELHRRRPDVVLVPSHCLESQREFLERGARDGGLLHDGRLERGAAEDGHGAAR